MFFSFGINVLRIKSCTKEFFEKYKNNVDWYNDEKIQTMSGVRQALLRQSRPQEEWIFLPIPTKNSRKLNSYSLQVFLDNKIRSFSLIKIDF